MAFTVNDDQNEQNDQQAENNGSQSSLLTGAGNLGQSTSTAAPQPGARQGSGRFTNIQKYVKANQPGAQNLAQRIGSGLESQLGAKEREVGSSMEKLSTGVTGAQQSLSDLQKQKEQFKKATSGFGVPTEQSVQEIQGFTQAPAFSSYLSGLSGSNIDEGQLKTQAGEASGQLSSYQNLFGERQKQAGSAAGRENLLSEFVAGKGQAVRPAYSAGQRQLDQLILGGNVSALQSLIDRVGAKQAGISQFGQGLTEAQKAIQDVQSGESEFMTGAQQDIASAKEALVNPIQKRAEQMNIANPELISRAQKELGAGVVSEDILNQLGLQAGTNIYGLDLGSYLATDPTKVGISQAATGTERQLYGELSKLLTGQDKALISQQDQSIKPISIDTARLQKDLSQAKSDYESAYNTATDTQLTQLGRLTPAQLEQRMAYYRANEDMNAPGIKEIYSTMENAYNDWINRHYGNVKVTRA